MADKRWEGLVREASDTKIERMRLRNDLKMAHRDQLKAFDKETKAIESSTRLAVERYTKEAYQAGASIEEIIGKGEE